MATDPPIGGSGGHSLAGPEISLTLAIYLPLKAS